MSHLKSITYAGKEYPVTFKQTPNWSYTGMNKKGLVLHVTTSHSYVGGLSWLTQKGSGVSCLFIVGYNPGEIAQIGEINQKLWHAGNVSNPSERFKNIAVKTSSGGYVNPNLYLDGIEFVGGVDKDGSGKVERDEINLTEWQYACAEQIAKWHAQVCDYELKEENIVIHQDIASYKPDMTDILEEVTHRLFRKKEEDHAETIACQATVEAQAKRISELESFIARLFAMLKTFIK